MITMVRNLYYKIIRYYYCKYNICILNKKAKKRFNKSTKELFVVINLNYLLRENKIPKKDTYIYDKSYFQK